MTEVVGNVTEGAEHTAKGVLARLKKVPMWVWIGSAGVLVGGYLLFARGRRSSNAEPMAVSGTPGAGGGEPSISGTYGVPGPAGPSGATGATGPAGPTGATAANPNRTMTTTTPSTITPEGTQVTAPVGSTIFGGGPGAGGTIVTLPAIPAVAEPSITTTEPTTVAPGGAVVTAPVGSTISGGGPGAGGTIVTLAAKHASPALSRLKMAASKPIIVPKNELANNVDSLTHLWTLGREYAGLHAPHH